MAWFTFIIDHLIILYIILYTPRIEIYDGIINTFFILSGSIIGAYIGFSAWDDVSAKKSLSRIDIDEGPTIEDQADTDER